MDDDGRQIALKMLEIAALRIIKMDDRDQEVIGLLRIVIRLLGNRASAEECRAMLAITGLRSAASAHC